MYNISRSKTGGVVLQCKVCSHAGGASDAEAHSHRPRKRADGQADVQGPRVVGLTGDYDNLMGNAGQRFLPCTGAQWMGTG
jgi:hypothetical protein